MRVSEWVSEYVTESYYNNNDADLVAARSNNNIHRNSDENKFMQ